jgi:hypothetical protein
MMPPFLENISSVKHRVAQELGFSFAMGGVLPLVVLLV